MPHSLRSRARPSLAVLLPLLLTLAVTAALGWRAWEARREHRRAAEQTVRDYAAFAATIAATNVEAAMDRVLLYAFYGADLAEQRGTDDPVPPEVLATNPPEAGRCASHYPNGRWFARIAPDGTMEVAGPIRPELARWLADTLVVLQRDRTTARRGNLFPAPMRTGPAVAYRLRRNAAGDAVEAHALAHCFESREGPVFDEARRRTPLLPPTLPAGSDAAIELSVTDPRGRVVYGTPASAGAAFVGTRPPDRAGPLGGLVFSVSVPESVAEALVAGGIPAAGLGTTWLLLLLAGCLGAATLVQVHRSWVLVRARERFVASVSHELRTPLQLLLLFAQLLRMGRAGSEREREEALAIIERETRRLMGLVERVLAFGGTESGTPGRGAPASTDNAGEPTDVSVVARETVEAFRLLADEAGVRLIAELPDRLAPVRAGAGAVRQVLFNLLDNAVRYGPRGQRVLVSAAAEDGGVRLVVEDEGPGIPAADRERVWLPFHRLEREGGPERSGSGIGLAVVREAVEAAGGRAWFEDMAGTGMRVVVRLPFAASPVEAG